MISILLATETTKPALLLSDVYPGFDGMDSDIMECDSNTRDGSFTFDSGRGITYFVLSDNMFYLEYYAPIFYWIGHSPAGIIIIHALYRYLSGLRYQIINQ